MRGGAGEVAQGLWEYIALSEEQGLPPSTHIRLLTQSVNPAVGDLIPLPSATPTHDTHHLSTHAHYYENKIHLKITNEDT